MPTHTPSPHRFLAPKAPPSHANPTPSGLRNVLTSKTPQPKEHLRAGETPGKKITPARQFVLGSGQHGRRKSNEDGQTTARGPADARMPATPGPGLRLKPKRTFARVESIEGSQSSPVGTQEDGDGDGGEGVLKSVELDDNEMEDEHEMLFDPTAQHKRRRVSLSSSPPLDAPRTPVPAHAGSSHMFKLPVPRTPAPFTAAATSTRTSATTITTTSSTTTTPASHRPQFLLPTLPPSPTKPSKPLPEIFSPSRKTGKYLPNGLASTATGWIIDMAGNGYAAQQGVSWGKDRDDGVKLRLRVSMVSRGRRWNKERCGVEGQAGKDREVEEEVECHTNSIVYVLGTTEPGLYNASRSPNCSTQTAETRILLAGQGGVKGVGGVRVQVGSVIGIRQPLWEVGVKGEVWMVGVDWIILS